MRQKTTAIGIFLVFIAAVWEMALPARGNEPASPASNGAVNRWQQPPAPNCATSKAVVRLASAEMAEIVGLRLAQVREEPLQHTLQRNVELAYNANRYARISSRVPGVIAQVLQDLGAPVQKDDSLVVIESSELGAAKAALLQAMETAKLWETNAVRERSLVQKGIGVERDAMEAETKAAESRIEVNKARQQLLNLGLSSDQLQAIEEDGDTSSLLQVRAPFAGTLVERSAVLGELVEAGRPLLTVVDTSVMWGIVDLLESDLAWVKAGQKVDVQLDAAPGKVFTGALTWISTEITEKTRTIAARVELDNAEGKLRANMFGSASIRITEGRQALTVPKEAVQWEGCCNIVFVQTENDARTFHPARLTLGFASEHAYEVLDGLHAGETIVSGGSFILKNELLKDSIGAGCCEVEHLDK